MADEETDRGVEEIRSWFDERGFELVVHETKGGWRAPFMPKESRYGSADYGVGATALEAAEDAKRKFEASGRNPMVVRIEPAVERNEAMPISVSKQVVDQGEGRDEGSVTGSVHMSVEATAHVTGAIETLEGYGWRLWFETEPDGRVTGLLQDYDSGEILKAATGSDHEDAWLELGIDTKPPSEELRVERRRRLSGD